MRQLLRTATVVASLGVVALTAAPGAVADDARPRYAPNTLTVPDSTPYPESIAASPAGDIFVGSITNGAISKFAAGSTTGTTLVAAGTNPGVAGVFYDPTRKVLWACSIDLTFQQPTELRAFDPNTGALIKGYVVPDGGVCGDITISGPAVYITDTTNPTGATQPPGRILKLTTPNPRLAINGTLKVWSADPAFTGTPGLQINGITYDGGWNFYTGNYTTGELLRVPVAADGSALPAVPVPGGTFNKIDGIRMLSTNKLLVTENPVGVSVVDVRTGARTLLSNRVGQPTSVIRVGTNLWVTDCQVLDLQAGLPARPPFLVYRVPLV